MRCAFESGWRDEEQVVQTVWGEKSHKDIRGIIEFWKRRLCVGGDSSGVIERRWLPITDCFKGKNVT